MTELILASVAIGIFIIYNIVMFCLFGMPASLSNTYYYLNNRWPGSGWAFTLMMIVASGLLVYPWIHVSYQISDWSHYLGFLPFMACSMLIFVSIAPNFRTEKGIESVHMWCAKLSAVFALVWSAVACWKIAYIIPLWIGLCWLIAWLTKTMKSGRDWWWEMCAFGPTFTAIITELALHIND